MSPAGGVLPLWSPDGRRLYHVGPVRMMMVVEVTTDPTFTPAAPAEAFDASVYDISTLGGHDRAPDGERFLMRVPGGSAMGGAGGGSRLVVVDHWLEELRARVPTN